MGYYWFVLVFVVLMHQGTLKTTPIEELTVNLNLNDRPNGGPPFESPGMETEEWKSGKILTKDPSCDRKRNQKHGKQAGKKIKRILGGKMYEPQSLVSIVPDYENWMASIKSVTDQGINKVCGGVLIKPKHILTALHCIFDEDQNKFYPKEKVKIYFDQDHLQVWKSAEFEAAEYFFVKGKNGNPEYLGDTFKLKDDIAVIKLGKIKTLSPKKLCLQSIPISTRSGIPISTRGEYWIAGWGIYSSHHKGPAHFLEYTNKIPPMDCPSVPTIRPDKMMCFMNTNEDATCPGDSGSPGVVSINGAWHVQGIHIRGRVFPGFKTGNCSELKSISLDIDVFQYRELIQKWTSQSP